MVWLFSLGTRPHQSRTLVHRHTNWPRYKRSAIRRTLWLKRNFWWKVQWLPIGTIVDSLINRPVPLVFGFGNRNILWLLKTTSSRNSLRRFVDCHWYRGNSYLRLGWEWIKGVSWMEVIPNLCLSGEIDPEPALASSKSARKLNASFRSELFLCFCSFVSQPGQEPVLSALE